MSATRAGARAFETFGEDPYLSAQMGNSDWGAIHSTVASANAGLTVEMPGGYYYADYLVQAVQNGQVSQATLDTMVSRLLTQMFRFGMFDKAPSGSRSAFVTTPAHAQVALRGDEEGTVLLKDNGILPLSASSTGAGGCGSPT